MSLEFNRKKYCYIEPTDIVRVTTMGSKLIVKSISNVNKKCHITMLSGRKYKDNNTGEVKEFKKPIENRSQGDYSVGRTRRNLAGLINCNCSGQDIKKCAFITLTYAEDGMQDQVKLYNDFKKFVGKFRYHYGKDVEYIMLPAPQMRRLNWSFHLHCILIFRKKSPFIDNKVIQEMWGHGITNSQYKLYGNIDDLGCYLIGHLKDMPLEDVKRLGIPYDEKNIKEVWIDYKTGEQLEKPLLIVKGIRTQFYPPNFKMYRASGKIKRPTMKDEKYHELRKEVDYRKPTSCSTLQIKDKEKGWSNTIKTEKYNLDRKSTLSKPTKKDLEYINRKKKKKIVFNEVVQDEFDFD